MPAQQTIRIADRESNYQWSQKQGQNWKAPAVKSNATP